MTLSRIFSACTLALMLSFLLAGGARADALQDINKLMKQGQLAQALDQVDKHLAGKPKDAQGRFLKGLILTEMNKPNEAAAVFQKLTEDYPELPEPYNNLAVIYAQQKQFEKAKQSLEMAIRTHPSYATAHENLGDIYTRMASQAYDKALQIDSSNTSAQTKLSMIRDLMGGNARQGAAATTKPAIVVAAAEPKAAEPKPAEPVKPVEAKPAEPVKPAEPAKPAAAKPVEAKPVAAPAKTGNGDVTADVTKAVEGWAAAWSKKDVKGYLAHYARDFKTPGGEARAKWETERSQRVNKPGSINVGVDGLRVTAEGNDKATVHFRQHYKSASLKTSSNKVLVFVRQDGKWLIQQERVGN
ncbi:MAG TPA: tetratricopeptide repeat protein [Rhodocyclaceae bacterium]|nr:tetratricopeptide repeat protein [Rhodocyclaceae bacterium]